MHRALRQDLADGLRFDDLGCRMITKLGLERLSAVSGGDQPLRLFAQGICQGRNNRVPAPDPVIGDRVPAEAPPAQRSLSAWLFIALPGRVAFAKGRHYKTRSKLGRDDLPAA